MSTALDMTVLLETATLGTAGADMFANVMPETPATVTSCFDSPGEPPVMAHHMSLVNQKRRVQIQCRNADPALAASQCQACLDALSGQMGATANTRTYEGIRALGSATLLARDDNGLTVFYGELEATIDLG